ncbi:inositol monophosphatase [Candidatus Saccharibacteria bacterium]|nr:inositol monophosphatase [Candidatus Saccharibacteria bacterium]
MGRIFNGLHISKSDNSPVTELDVKVETIIKQRLATQFPHIGFHGEETEDTPSTSGALWIVDPIDGTSSFIHGLPYCTNMAGLVVDGVTVASIIYQFPTDELYTALRGEGAYRNGERITIKNTEPSNSLVFSSSFVYTKLSHIFTQHKIGIYAPLGASGYEYTRLAAGNIQAVTKLRCKSQIHDNVPGVLLAEEAGAVLIPFTEKQYTYESLSFIIGTPNIMNVVEKHFDEISSVISVSAN